MPRMTLKELKALGCDVPKGKAKPTRPYGAYRSQLEADFAEYLRISWGERGWCWDYEAVTINLGPGLRYTPDFVRTTNGNVYAYEVKGSWKAKGARDSRSRLKMAAGKMRSWTFFGVTRDRNGLWHLEKIGG